MPDQTSQNRPFSCSTHLRVFKRVSSLRGRSFGAVCKKVVQVVHLAATAGRCSVHVLLPLRIPARLHTSPTHAQRSAARRPRQTKVIARKRAAWRAALDSWALGWTGTLQARASGRPAPVSRLLFLLCSWAGGRAGGRAGDMITIAALSVAASAPCHAHPWVCLHGLGGAQGGWELQRAGRHMGLGGTRCAHRCLAQRDGGQAPLLGGLKV